jgi:cytochrome c
MMKLLDCISQSARGYAMKHIVKTRPLLSRAIVATPIVAILAGANAQQNDGSVQEGRRLAHADCAQCHGVDVKGYSTNPTAPTFEDIANVPGMTDTALTVALQTSHRSMPNFIIKGRDAQNIIAYILSLKRK